MTRTRTVLLFIGASLALLILSFIVMCWIANRQRTTLMQRLVTEIGMFRREHGRLPYLCEISRRSSDSCHFSAFGGTCLHYYRKGNEYLIVQLTSFDEADIYDSETNRTTHGGAAFPGFDPDCE